MLRTTTTIIAFIAGLGMAVSAQAWTPSAKALQTAAAGKVWVDVSPDPAGPPALGRAVVDIDAPPSVVWDLMMDCAVARRIMPHNKGCRVLSRDPAGKWDVREHIMETPILPDMKAVFRSDLTPERRMVVSKAAGGDMKVLHGEWRLEPLDGGKRTRVTQEMSMQPDIMAPGMMIRAFVRGLLSDGMANLKKEAEKVS